MGVYDRQIETALRLIKAKGEPCQWQSSGTAQTIDDTKPWIKVPGQIVTNDVSILFTSSASNAFARLFAGNNVESNKQTAIMGAVSFTPNMRDIVIRKDGTKLELSSIDKLAPNGDTIMWWLTFKQ